jgi:hypothetical protein
MPIPAPPPPPPPPVAVAPSPLTPEQWKALADAQALYRPIRRAVGYARFDGWTVGVFAALTTVCGLSSPVSLVLGVGMGVVAFVELSAAARLGRDLHPAAPRTLGLNQLALALLLIGYACYGLYTGFGASSLDHAFRQAGISEQEMREMRGLVDNLQQLITTLVYGTLIAVAVIVQGGTALFYFSRGKHLRRYLEQSPPWARHMVAGGYRAS